MKKILFSVFLLFMAINANAYTYVVNGVVYGTVCRNGTAYTSYPMQMSQPVGSVCPIRNDLGVIVGQGVVVME